MAAVEINGRVGLAGVSVNPGDLIVADGSGICVVPVEHVDAIAREVRAIQEGEQSVKDAIDAGLAPRAAPAYTI